MDANSHRMKQVKVREGEDAHISAQIGQANLDYVKQLMSLIFSRIEDKHRNVTEMFRFMDQRGQGKIDRKDFYSAIDRMRISLSREDANKGRRGCQKWPPRGPPGRHKSAQLPTGT